MSRSLAAVALLAALSFPVPQAAEAQLGGMIRKKVKEAIKTPEVKDPDPQPAAPSSTAASSSEPAGHPRVPGARALLISKEMLARVRNGLDAEAAMLRDLDKQIAAYPSPEKIQACKIKASEKPEGQRVMNPGNFLKEGMTPEQIQAAMMKMTTESDAYFKKECPWDENKWSDYNRAAARTEIRTKAAAHALPAQRVPADTLVKAVPVEGLAGIALSEGEFGELIERILKYCELKETMDVSPKTGGIKVPGVGQDIYWVYTESELRDLETLDCEAFIKKYGKQVGANA